MRMQGLTEEQKQVILETRAKNHSLRATKKVFEGLYPDATKYSRGSWQLWFNDPETQKQFRKVEAEVRKGVRNYSFANKDSRLLAHIEVSEKILDKIRELSATDKQFPVLARELRENLKVIREEVDPFNLEDEQTRSAFESFIDRAKGTPWEKFFQSTHGTQDN
jgi:hypothetical protein